MTRRLTKLCPDCEEQENWCPMANVLYMGFPMLLCEECSLVLGFWSWLPIWLPVSNEDDNFVFMQYRGWSYPRALWHWLTHKEDA